MNITEVHMPRRTAHNRVFAESKPDRLAKGNAPTVKGYKVVSVSLYSDQAEVVDRAAEELALAGYSKANRSLIVQTAIQRLSEELDGKSREDVLRYFLEQQVKRPLSAARPRATEIVRSPAPSRKSTAKRKPR